MLRNCLSLAVRGLRRSAFTAFANLLGLTLAFTVCLTIWLWTTDELSVDKFHENDAQLFVVMSNVKNGGNVLTRDATPIGLAHVLSNELPEVQQAATVTPMHWFPKVIVTHNQKKIKCEAKFVSKPFFEMMSYPLLHGDKTTSLSTKESILISANVATKLFGSTDAALGKPLPWELTNIAKFGTITGVFSDVPAISTDKFDIVFSIDMLREIMGFAEDDMNAFGPQTFVMLPPDVNVGNVNNKIDQLIKQKRPDLSSDAFFLTRYSSRYLYQNWENGMQSGGKIVYVQIFCLSALAIVILACINFIILSASENNGRIKEFGIRKIIGASRGRLMFRAVAEATIIAIVAATLAILIINLLLPVINLQLEKQMAFPFALPNFLAFYITAVVIGILCGAYPTWNIIAINPAKALTGITIAMERKSSMRQTLVIFQFGVSIIAIFLVIVVHQQLEYLNTKSLGYKKENLIYFENAGAIAENANAFIASLKNIPGVINASSMIGNFTGIAGSPRVISINNKQVPMHLNFINFDMIETMDLKLLEGRTFSRAFNDSSKIILNEKAIAALAITDPVGKTIPFGAQRVEIIGVVQDFHLNSLHSKIEPMIFQLVTDQHWNIMVRLEDKDQREIISAIENHFHMFNPGMPFDFRFLEHELNRQYRAEEKIQYLSLVFAFVAIAIAMLGLYSTAASVCSRRMKEIAIRKVVGATILEIILLLASYFVKLGAIAMAIALPIGFMVGKNWLNRFAYSIGMSWPVVLVTASIALTFLFMAIGVFVVHAARKNPVTMLKAN